MTTWRKVDKDEFFESGIDIKKSKLLSSYTNCSANFAESTFSVDGHYPTHKTIHNNGLLADPDYFMAGDKMTAHKNAEIAKAKLDNLELALFGKFKGRKKWFDLDLPDLVIDCCESYFLCLPKHEKAVLNSLNGGESEFFLDGSWRESCSLGGSAWHHDWYMSPEVESRIKPRKEKRAIGVNVKTGQTTSAYQIDEEGNYAVNEVRLNYGMSDNWQFIEIEVEV